METKITNPWPGLSSYKDPATIKKVPLLFCGREKETQDLYNLVINNILFTLYGKSGLGKTSLLNAGVFPLLRKKNYFPISIRLGVVPDNKSLQNTIIEIIETRLREKEGDVIELKAVVNEYNLNMPETTSSDYLWTYFASHKFIDSAGESLSIVLAFDQFEEVLYSRPDEVVSLLRQILYLMNDNNSFPSFVNDGITYSYNINWRFIIAIREDYLFMLEDVIDNNYLQSMKKNRYRLKEITLEGAKEIVKKPGMGYIDVKDEDVIVDRIIHEAQDDDGTISSLMISFLCNRLFSQAQDKDGIITLKQVEDNGFETLETFCRQQLKQLPEKEFDNFCRHLITEDGRRKIIDLLTFSNDVPSGSFLFEEKTRLLHYVNISSNKEQQVEIIHDKFSAIVLGIRTESIERRKTEEVLRAHEQEQKRLLDEKEQQRKKKNIDYNHKKYISEHNVLTHKGRRLIDNALDFGEFRSLMDSAHRNVADKILDTMRVWTIAINDFLYDETDSKFINQQVFSDPLLKDSSCVINFYNDENRSPTIDGIYEVELNYYGSLISDIFFKGKRIKSDGSESFDSPIYILGGYCGIHIDYDDNQREIERTYLDDIGNPVVSQDGYSVVQTQYDDYNNPIKIRYYNYQDGYKVPARHNNGNFGFNSVYDNCGNEVERYFVDEDGLPIKIVSGVYGKRMIYDKESFHLSVISNINSDGELMPDLDGYVTRQIKYDENGKPTFEVFLDENENLWKKPDGTCGSVDEIDYLNRTIITYYTDENGFYAERNDGIFKTIIKYNEKGQIKEYYSLDKDNNICDNDNQISIQLFEYDEAGRLSFCRFLDKERKYVSGKKYDYNKEGTHVIREFVLSENGIGRNEDLDVEGIEYDLSGDSNLPILKLFINENKQFKKCNDGYYAMRTWEDDKERVIKQLYYDVDGTPMHSDSGIFGKKVEFIDENTIKYINLDKNEKLMEDDNGVAFTIETNTSSGSITTSYNKEGTPYADDEWVYVFQERNELEHGFQKLFYVQNSKQEPVKILRPRLGDVIVGVVSCFYDETIYDEKGRPISQYFKDANNCLVEDNDGDSYTIWEYIDEDNIEIVSLYSISNILKTRLRRKRDEKGRVIELAYLDKDNNILELESGYSEKRIEYYEEENRKSITLFNSKGEVCNNKEGIAHCVIWYDQLGREVGRKDETVDGKIHGYISFREFVDSERRECAYYQHQEDGQGNIIPYENGSTLAYIEDDADGRTVKELYLDSNKMPIPDHDGDYGVSYEYDDEKGLTIITCLDESGKPHNNKYGYGKIWKYTENDREKKSLYYSVEGAPVTCDELLGCYGYIYEYPSEHSKIIGFLNENGDITTNNNGYAYKEECVDIENGSRQYFYYDEERDNTQSKEDDNSEYGYSLVDEEQWRKIISLGKDGYVANNTRGYAIKRELYEDGELRFYQYFNANNVPIADSYGDYGTEIIVSDDGSTIRLVSLDKKFERHLNDYGFCYVDIITDIAGDHIRIFRDLEERQVLPKQSFASRVKNYFSKFTKREKAVSVFNCRQIGAISKCVLGKIEGYGLGRKYGLQNTYILLQYGSWSFGDDSNSLTELIKTLLKKTKHLVLLPVILKGSLLQELGEIIELDFPSGKIGMRFMEWSINNETLQRICEKMPICQNADSSLGKTNHLINANKTLNNR